MVTIRTYGNLITLKEKGALMLHLDLIPPYFDRSQMLI